MQNKSSRIDPNDVVILFVDLQSGIVELSKTISLDRLKKGVHGLSTLAKIFAMPAIVSGVAGQDGLPRESARIRCTNAPLRILFGMRRSWRRSRPRSDKRC
jgi:hypothetical protein